jgi:hypothetical protein
MAPVKPYRWSIRVVTTVERVGSRPAVCAICGYNNLTSWTLRITVLEERVQGGYEAKVSPRVNPFQERSP